MKPKDKATARPWNVRCDDAIISNHGVVCDDVHLTKADRDFIVKAVNNFDRLLEACLLASHKLSEHYTENESEELRVIRQAIKNAKAKEASK